MRHGPVGLPGPDGPGRLADADEAGRHHRVGRQRAARGVHGDAVAQTQGLGEDQLLVRVGGVQLGHVDLLGRHPGLLAGQLGRGRHGEVAGTDRVRLDAVVDAGDEGRALAPLVRLVARGQHHSGAAIAGEKAFVAGADINELAQQTPVSAKEYTHRGQAIIDAIENLGKPVIACINGFALGGGCELAMACTMRLASDNAKLGQPEVKLGLIPGYGGTQRLPRLVGKGLAMQQILTGEMITAQEAHRIGLVNEVVPQAELIGRAEAIAAKIIANSPLAIQYAMEAVNRGFDMTLADGLFLEATLFAVCCSTEDKNEGTRAFLEKRAAQFKGK